MLTHRSAGLQGREVRIVTAEAGISWEHLQEIVKGAYEAEIGIIRYHCRRTELEMLELWDHRCVCEQGFLT